MDEDDEFGDLYGDVGVGIAAEEEPEAAPPPVKAASGFEFDDEDAMELYGDLSVSKTDENPAKNNGGSPTEHGDLGKPQIEDIPAAKRFSKEDVGTPQERISEDRGAKPHENGDGSDSESDDDDLQIVLNAERRAPVEPEPNAVPGEGNEEADDVPAPKQTWVDEQTLPIQSETPALQPPTSALPPGLLPLDPAARPVLPIPGASRPPLGRPFTAPFKYIRAPGGTPAVNSAPGVVPGPGRGFPPGVWAPNRGSAPLGAPRSWPGPPHSDFHLPPSKSVFEMDLDSFEEKPWRTAQDITDYFNFGFNETTWKQYCQQLSQLRLESTMQTKISVYESGRSDQPIGRAIQVEGGVGERRPSYDIRRNRNRDSNEVIEIVLHEPEEDTPVHRAQVNDGVDYELGSEQDGAEPSSRAGRYMDMDGPLYPRPRGPYRMFPGGPFPRGIRPPFYDGMPPLPMHMRPDGYLGGSDYDPPRRSRNAQEEHSSGSVADRRYSERDSERRSSRREKREDDDEKSDEHKRSYSDDKNKQSSRQRYSESSRSSRRKEGDTERSSYSDEEDRKSSRHRSSRKEGPDGDYDKYSHHKKDDKDRKSEQRKEDDAGRKVQREEDSSSRRESSRSKEDPYKREKEDQHKREREDSYKREREEPYKREREDSYKREREDPYRREREDSHKRDRRYDDGYDTKRRSTDDGYERKEREDPSRSSKQKADVDSEEHPRKRDAEEHSRKRDGEEHSRKRDGEEHTRRRDSEDSSRKKSSRTDVESEEHGRKKADAEEYSRKSKEDARKHSSRSKDKERNGSTTEYAEEKTEKKKRKSDEYQKEKEEEADRKKSRNQTTTYPNTNNAGEGYNSSDGEDGGKHRKGRSKMERLNRERPPTVEEDSRHKEKNTKKEEDSRHKKEEDARHNVKKDASSTAVKKDGASTVAKKDASSTAVKKDGASTVAKKDVENPSSSTRVTSSNGDKFEESIAKRRERFMNDNKKIESSNPDKKKAMPSKVQTDTSEFKHERPARKRRWGDQTLT